VCDDDNNIALTRDARNISTSDNQQVKSSNSADSTDKHSDVTTSEDRSLVENYIGEIQVLVLFIK